MPSLDLCRQLQSSNYHPNGYRMTGGVARKLDADMLVEATWDEDIDTRIAYFYDYYHDDYKDDLTDMKPEHDIKKIPISVKYMRHESQSLAKDPVTYRLQFKPSQEMCVDYYSEYIRRYGATFPCGLYCDIPDNTGKYQRWLVVASADINDPQFPTFEILRCDYVFRYLINGRKYGVPGVLRSQNSYNSGVWLDYRVESPEDQQKFVIPLNMDTELLYHNTRLVIDAPVTPPAEPRTWRTTKINRLAASGLVNVTTAMDRHNQFTDLPEFDNQGYVKCWWADLGKDIPQPPPEPLTVITSKITYSGVKPQIKIGGSYKKFSAIFYKDSEQIDPLVGAWSIERTVKDRTEIENAIDLVDIKQDADNVIRVKFIGDNSYLGQILKLSYTTASTTAVVEVEIVGL